MASRYCFALEPRNLKKSRADFRSTRWQDRRIENDPQVMQHAYKLNFTQIKMIKRLESTK